MKTLNLTRILTLISYFSILSLALALPKSQAVKVSWNQQVPQKRAVYDFMNALKSVGKSTTFTAEKDKFYEIKISRVIIDRDKDPFGKAEVIDVLKQVVQAKSNKMIVGVYLSNVYQIEKGSITINSKEKNITLEVDHHHFSYQLKTYKNIYPWAQTSKIFSVTNSEQPFLVMYDPNDMSGETMDMAIKHAMRRGRGEIICSIRIVKRTVE